MYLSTIVLNHALCSRVILLALILIAASALAQDIVAEGEYEMHAVSDGETVLVKTTTHWILYNKGSGGYELKSEIQNMPDGKRLIQVEELDDHLIPSAIGYELFLKDRTEPTVSINCEFGGGYITCNGQHENEPAAASKPYEHSGPFMLSIKNMFTVDMPWLLGGGVNMARLENGKTSISTISVSGGGKKADWGFAVEERGSLELVGTDSVEWNGTSIAARHYTLRSGDEPINVWIAGSGVPVKLSGHDPHDSVVLTRYKQYVALIPELRVEDRGNRRP